MKYLLDTCVISELVSSNPEKRVIGWIDDVEDELIYLSAITIGEIQRGIEKLPASKRRQKLHDWMQDELLARFDGRILAINTTVMLKWGTLVAQLEAKGRPLPAIDSLIAALALEGDFQLVTRNEKDFQDTGVTVFTPWKSNQL